MRRLIILAMALMPAVAFAQSTRPVLDVVNARSALGKKIPEIRLAGVSLSDALDFIREVSGANIHVNWRALELLNVTRQTPVTLRLTDVTIRRALRSLLDETPAGENLT